MKCVLSDSEVTYTTETKKDKMCTVYVPFDCNNWCKFCTSKEFYSMNRPNKERVLEWLRRIAASDITEVVFTGGEPTFDIETLREMVDICKDKNVYINTTLPSCHADEFISLVNANKNVKGVNISRHLQTHSEDSMLLCDIAKDDKIAEINTNVRINVFVGEGASEWHMKGILERWEKVYEKKKSLDVSFRHDYNTMTPENLHNLDTKTIRAATKLANYYGRVYCHVCDKVLFKTDSGMEFRVHRGLQKTRIKIGDIVEMQELVLFPDGELCTDWDKTTDGINEFLAMLNVK